jgi:tight adherence protein C
VLLNIIAQFELVKILPWAIFGGVAVVAWIALEYFGGKRSRVTERLDEMRNPNARRREEVMKEKKGDAMARVLEMATPAFAKPLAPKDEVAANKLKGKLSAAGFRSETAPSIFLGFKFIGLVAGLVFVGGYMMATAGMTQKSLIYTICGAALAFYLPDLVVGFFASSRKKSIFLSLPDALDLMVVCVEAGLGLDQAMRKVADEMKRTARIIAEEFNLSNFQLQMGRPKAEVLHELGQRTGVDDLRSLAAILIQADKFGSSVAQALRVQSDSMRVRRRQMAEEKAAKTAVKLIFPLVIFIFPGIFVVLVGPAAITMINQMFPAMGAR